MTSLAYVAGRGVRFDEEELAAARRRALFVAAAGGDPHRELRLDDAAVTTLARDLDSAGRRAELATGLEALRHDAADFPLARAVLDELVADDELAWRAYACALLAEELAGE